MFSIYIKIKVYFFVCYWFIIFDGGKRVWVYRLENYMYFLVILFLYFSVYLIISWGMYCFFVYGFIFFCIGFMKKVYVLIYLLRLLFIFFMLLFYVLMFLFLLGERIVVDGLSYLLFSLLEKICFFFEVVFICLFEFCKWLVKKIRILFK